MRTKQISHLTEDQQKLIKDKLQSFANTAKDTDLDYDTVVTCEIKSLKLPEGYTIESLNGKGENNGKNSDIYFILQNQNPIAVIKVLSGTVIEKVNGTTKALYAAAAAPVLSKINAEKFNQVAEPLNLNLELPSIVMNNPVTFEQFNFLSLAPFCNGTSLDQFIGKTTDIEKDIKPIKAITIIDTAAEPGSEFDPDLTLQESLSKLSGITNLDHIGFSPWFKKVSQQPINEELYNEIKTFLQRSFKFKDNSNRLNLAVSLTLHVINAKKHKLYVDASLSNFIVTQEQDYATPKTYQELVDIIKTIQPDYSPSSLSESIVSSASTTSPLSPLTHVCSTPPRIP